MGSPVFVARLRVTNGGGTFDSLNRAAPSIQPRITFSVSKTLESSPNTATIEIYNLAPETIDKIRGVVRTRVEFSAAERAELLAAGASADPIDVVSDGFGLGAVVLDWGYVDSEDLDSIDAHDAALRTGFIGQSTRMRTWAAGADTVLTIDAEDGGALVGAAAVVQRAGAGPVQYRAKSYAPGTDVTDIIGDLVNACGLTVDRSALRDQLTAAMASRGLPAGDLKIVGGYSAAGPARDQVESFLRAVDLRWSVQDGELLILGPTGTIPGIDALALDSNTVIGEPERAEATRLIVSTLADASAIPGRRVEVRTSQIDASYRIDSVSVSGDNGLGGGGTSTMNLDELQTIPGVF